MSYFKKVAIITNLLFVICGFSMTAEARRFSTVVLDAGHGGRDRGCSYGRVYEKHFALDTALRVEYLLKRRGYRVRMTRRSDVYLSLGRRCRIGNRYSNSIFVSIHYNYTYKRSVHGIETFYYSSRSKPLARYIQKEVLKKHRSASRGVKFARLYVLRHTKSPAALVECGFLSNSRERARCRKGWYRQRMAEGIVNGISRYQYARRKGWVR